MLTDIRPIHTLNARDNMFLDIVKAHLNLDSVEMLREIQALRREVEDVLASKGIRYENLRSALVPSQNRREIALVFDSSLIENSWYGRVVFEQVMPLFNAASDHSVLAGDYGAINDGDEPLLAGALNAAVAFVRPVAYRHSSYFFIVYINNLTDTMVDRFDQGLRPFAGYVGMADMTTGSAFKFLISNMLANVFIKHGRTIIQGHEDDRPNTEDVNTIGWSFERFGYACRSLMSYIQGPLLTYKIERPVLSDQDSDAFMSLNAISAEPHPLSDFTVVVDEAKAAYIRNHNAPVIARAGLASVSVGALQELIAAKINASYIYRLEYLANHEVTKFNIILEVPAIDGGKPIRLLAGLKYKPAKKILNLITLF